MMASGAAELLTAEDSLSESVSKEVFSTYVCRSLDRGLPHPGDIAEPSSLSAIALPPCKYPLWDALQDHIVKTGKLSQLQLEGIMHACNKFQEILPSGERAGFFIGDGAGVGKGRQIAGVIVDSYARGRRQHIWLSTSTDLQLDAQRDLSDLGCHINVINNCQTLDREQKALGLSKDFKEGVLFMTYSTLVSQAKGKSRMEQVIEWCGGPSFQGCLVFDECHKAKNFVPGKEAQSTKVSAAVIEIQQRLPSARVLYCSATGVSEVGNMAYMTRMGLWGPSTAFQGFQEFLDTMKRRGVSFMEMLAMEMKAEGKYVARGLSFKNAEFMEVEAQLTSQQIQMYDASVDVWQTLRMKMELALEMCGIPRGDVQKVFWAAQQRFFKLLCVSLKVPLVVKEAQAALSAGHCVVLGLQSTGESAVEAMGIEPGPQPGFMSATKELLARLIINYFPTKPPVVDGAPEHLQAKDIPACVEMKAELLEKVDALQLPPNFLDQLIDLLGGPSNVAEMTGRRGRIVRDSRGRHLFELRAKPDSNDMDSLNVRERDEFMKGRKLVAIISDAASTGISLHASRTAVNQRRRVHLTIELPWSADKAIQQLGRSHRSNQLTAPVYKLVSTQVGGEKRFAAAVARRLQSLGALTRGDRRAASGIDLSEQNFDTPLGRKSLRRMYNHVVLESAHLPAGVSLMEIYKDSDKTIQEEVAALQDPVSVMEHNQQMHAGMRGCCDMMGIGLNAPRNDTVVEERLKEPTKEVGDVRRFLNRILGLPIARQNVLFNYFAATLSAEIRAAKAEGRYSEGVGDMSGSNIALAGAPQVLWTDPNNPTMKTSRYNFIIDRGVTYEDAVKRLQREAVPGDESGFRRSRRPLFNRHLVVLALQKPGQRNSFTAVRPNTGDSYFDMDKTELDQKYVKVTAEEVQAEWQQMFEQTLNGCMHGRACQQGAGCQVGRRQMEVTILAGSIVLVWGVLEDVLERNERSLSRTDRMMRVVRVPLEGDRYLVGVRYPAALVPEVMAMLNSMQLVTIAGGQLQAASKTSVVKVKREAPTPVCSKSLAKAFRPPVTLMNFFKKKTSAPTSIPAANANSAAGADAGLTQRAASAPAAPLSKPSNTKSNPMGANGKPNAAGNGGKGHGKKLGEKGGSVFANGTFGCHGKAAAGAGQVGVKREREVEVLVIEDSMETGGERAGNKGKRQNVDTADTGESLQARERQSAPATSPHVTPPIPSPHTLQSSPPTVEAHTSHPLTKSEPHTSSTPPDLHPNHPPIKSEPHTSSTPPDLHPNRPPIKSEPHPSSTPPAASPPPHLPFISPSSADSARTTAQPNVSPPPSHHPANTTPMTGNTAAAAAAVAHVAAFSGVTHSDPQHATPEPDGRDSSGGTVGSKRVKLGPGVDALGDSLPGMLLVNDHEGKSGELGLDAKEHGMSPMDVQNGGEDDLHDNIHRGVKCKGGNGVEGYELRVECNECSDREHIAGDKVGGNVANLNGTLVHERASAEVAVQNGSTVVEGGMNEREQGLAVLLGMGFSQKQADKAMLLTRSDVQQAIELLLAGMA